MSEPTRVKLPCPECGKEFSRTGLQGHLRFRHQQPPPPNKASVEQAINEAVEAAIRQREEASKQEAILQEIEAWRHGERHLQPVALWEVWEQCPECRKLLESQLTKHDDSLSREQVRELARKYKDWPPPSFVLPSSKK